MTPDQEEPRQRPEILAPAGDPDAFRAALAAGADAVYLGMKRFNARGRAERFEGYGLASCVEAAHSRGVKIYVTLNTLLHDDELPLALEYAREAATMGVDAAIVQDPGFALRLRDDVPELRLHGSTQMSLHQAAQAVEAVKLLGLKRVIIARECSVAEIAETVEALRPLGADVEVFVHGALCFAYSGQCLMSNFAGRRSANRGICAQNCRFDFSVSEPLPKTGSSMIPLPVFDPKKATQLISMKDLAAFDSIAALADAGVGSFKIEGRLKGPSYVAEVVSLYRSALEAWERGAKLSSSDAERAAGRVYSRGFTNGYLAGDVRPSMRGDKRSLEGEADATVVAANRKSGWLILEPRLGHEIKAGQGYRYAHDRYRGGFRVQSVRRSKSGGNELEVSVRFGSEVSGRAFRRGRRGRRATPPPLPKGLAVYLNDDPEVASRTEELLRDVEIPQARKLGLLLRVSGQVGEPLRLEVRREGGAPVVATSETPRESAQKRELNSELLMDHLGRFGGTDYTLEELDSSDLGSGAFMSFPQLHELRRKIVASLEEEKRARRTQRSRPGESAPKSVTTRLAACVGSIEAARAAIKAGADELVVEDASVQQLEESSFAAWRSLGYVPARLRLTPVAHDVHAERKLIETLHERLPTFSFLAAHYGQLSILRDLNAPFSTDLYFNVYNQHAAGALSQTGATRTTLSLEVDAKEAVRVAARTEGIELEVVCAGAVYSMLTRQPYALDPEKELHCTSEHGHGYRITTANEPGSDLTILYEARELVGVEALPTLRGHVDAIRLDLSHHNTEAVAAIVEIYRGLLDHEPSEDQLAEAQRRHAELAPHGTFTGHLLSGARRFD